MSAPYVPDGQTPPTGSYTLPQDVIDDVVVETVNTPFTAAANNIAWMMLAFSGRIVSPQNFGAAADGTTDDTVAIQDAIDYLADLDGGVLYVPLATYRYTDTLTIPVIVSLWFEPGAVWQMHDATAPSIELGAGDQSTDPKSTWDNVRLEASSLLNAGLVLGCPIGPALVLMRNCVINVNGNYRSQIWRPDGAAYVAWENCRVHTNMTDSIPLRNDLGGFVWRGGTIKAMNAAFNDALVGGSGGDRFVEGATLDMSLCTDGLATAFAANNGSVSSVQGCRFIGEASQENSAITIQEGALINSGGHTFLDVIPYVAVGTAGDGSSIELLPILNQELPGTTFTLPAYYAAAAFNCGAASPPLITLSRPLVLGQTQDIAVRNSSGDAWVGSVQFTNGAGVDGVAYTEIAGAADGGIHSLRFAAMKFGLDTLYTQIGAGQIQFQA